MYDKELYQYILGLNSPWSVSKVERATPCAASAAAQCAPKVDNFFIFVDQSGSMYMTYYPLNAPKIFAAKQLITKLDGLIPELGYKAGIDVFAPFQEVQPLADPPRG